MLPPPHFQPARSQTVGRCCFMSPLRSFAWLIVCAIFFGTSPALAQTLPPVAACGLPAEAEGENSIKASVTYTLTADCEQTGEIAIANAPAGDPKFEVTINGGGHMITGGAFVFFEGRFSILNLNNVTIDGGDIERTEVISVGTLNVTDVTFTRASSGSMLASGQVNLNNVLLAYNFSTTNNLGGNGTAVHAGPNTTHAWNNVVLRNNIGNGGAISLLAGATLTTTGCLTLSGNAPYDVYAPAGTTWTDSSTGPCSGTIGNGDSSAIPAPALMACGFPEAGNLDVSATYTLSADCELTGGTYYISEDVSIRVIGKAHTLRSSRGSYHFRTAATSSLRLENVGLEGIRFFNWGQLAAERIKAVNTVNSFLLNMGEARFSNSLFLENRATSAGQRSVALAYNAYQNGYTSFTDVTFRGNTGGLGVLATFGAVIDLNGCVYFEDNSPVDTYIYPGRGGVVNDNRDPDCDSPIVDPLVPPPARRRSGSSSAARESAICNPHCALPPVPVFEECDLKLGAIGLICRPRRQPPVAAVWRIRSNPEGETLPAVGSFLLSVNQPQVEAAAEGLVACSADGRLAIYTGLSDELRRVFENSPQYDEELRVPRRYIVFSKGPEPKEGKVHNIVLDNALDGRVFGIVDTYGGPPAPECVKAPPAPPAPVPTPTPVYAAPVQPQAPQPDGSIIHVVREGDTLSAIAVAYRVRQLDIIVNNQLEHMGRWIYPGQELLIRAADG